MGVARVACYLIRLVAFVLVGIGLACYFRGSCLIPRGLLGLPVISPCCSLFLEGLLVMHVYP